jgi:hypothetical protein
MDRLCYDVQNLLDSRRFPPTTDFECHTRLALHRQVMIKR